MRILIVVSFLFFSCFCLAQQTDYVDFKTAKANIVFRDLSKSEVEGLITYEFEVLKDVDSIFVDAKNFSVIRYKLDNQFEDSLYNGKQLIIKHPFKSNTKHNVDIVWKTIPKKAMYFIDWNIVNSKRSRRVDSTSPTLSTQNKQIWTQGQGKYTSNWLPSIDDMNDKIEFDISIVFPEGSDVYDESRPSEVISNGKLVTVEWFPNKSIWHYDMQKPMSSYLVALAIGKYDKKVEYSKSGIPLEMYYYPKDSLKFEPTYRYTKHMFDFLEEEIGVPYPWQNYKQVPVKDFLYAGMENTGTTIFSDAFVIDSIGFVDKNYVNVNAHELAHQWFGNLVTETSGTHHWLQEGFATYYALLAEKELFGDDYYYWRLYEYAQELIDQGRKGTSTSLLNPKSSSTTFYKKGCLVLHMLRDKVGDLAFKKAIKQYLLKHQFKTVETEDFISEVEKFSNKDLSQFVNEWLIKSEFNYESIEEILYKTSTFIKQYVQIDCENYTSKCKDYLGSWISDEAKIKVVGQIPEKITKEDFKNSIKVRQAIARNLSKIPLELKEDYESLLDDKSYITKEAVLFTLWQNFPQERDKYLNKTRNLQGFNDKNIRILWLTLALITEGFEDKNKKTYFDELTEYTSSKYGFEVRQNAFQYLNQIQACNEVCKENLEQATKHHNWQFSKFAKALLKKHK